MTFDVADIITRAREGSKTALRQLQALRLQGVEIPPSALTLVRQRPTASHGASQDDLVEVDTVAEKRPSGKESELQSAIVAYLQGLGFYTMQTFLGSKRGGSVWMHKGLPDLICIRSGRVLFLEVKRPEKDSKATPEQLETHEAIRQQGGTCEIVRSIMDVHELLIREGML